MWSEKVVSFSSCPPANQFSSSGAFLVSCVVSPSGYVYIFMHTDIYVFYHIAIAYYPHCSVLLFF